MYNKYPLLFITFLLQTLLASATDRVSSGTGSWNTPGTWSPSGTPVAGDNITILSGHIITMNGNAGNCLSLTIQGTANWTQARTTNVGVGGLIMKGGTITGTSTGTLDVAGDFTTTGTNGIGRCNLDVAGTTTISTIVNITSTTGTKTFSNFVLTGTFNNTVNANILINGNFQNNGTFNMCMSCSSANAEVTFGGATSTTITGTSTTNFNTITIDKGTSSATEIDVQSQITMATGGLTLVNGTFKLTGASTIIPFPADISAAPYLIPATAGLWCNGGTINSNPALTSSVVGDVLCGNWTVAGLLRISAGTINLGTAADQRLRAENSGTTVVTVEGGTFNIAGRLSRQAVADNITFTMTGGTLNIPTVGSTDATLHPINIDQAGSSYTMSGGTIVLKRAGGANLGFLASAGTVGITGGTIQFGDATSPAGQTIQMNSIFNFANISVNSANVTCLLGNSLTILQALTINSGTFNANGFDLTIGGQWTNSGTFTPGANTVTFNGTGTQNITKASGETFNSLTINKTSGTVMLANNVNVNSTLTMTAGNIDCQSNTLTLGVSTASTGTLSYTAGTISGSFKRWINSTGVGILFPIGTSSDYRSALLTFTNLAGGTLKASFVSTNPGNSGLSYLDNDGITSIQNQYTEGYWDLTAANGLTSTNYALECTGNGFTSYAISSSTRLMYRATSGNPWIVRGTHVAASGNTAKRAAINGLSAQVAFGKPACSAYAAVSLGGNITPCISTVKSYSVNASTVGNVYTWSIVPPAAGSVTSGQGTPTATITWGGTGQLATVQMVERNSCGDNNTALTLPVYINPISTSTITGTTNVSTNQTGEVYFVDNVSGYTYTWSFPTGGGTIAGGQGTNSVTVNWGATAGTYSLRVDVTRLCGAADFRTVSVTVRGPFYSRASTNWSLASTWSNIPCGGTQTASATVPGVNDEVIICSAHTVIMNTNTTVRKLTINGNANWTAVRTVNVGSGGVTVGSTGNITGAVAGILTSTGGFTGVSNSNISSNTVIIRLQTTPQNITSDGALNILDITTTVSNTGTVTIANNGTLSGSGTLTQNANSLLNMNASTLSLSTLNASASGNTVNYGANGAQTIMATTYNHLTVSGTGTKTLEGATTVNGDVTISSGTATLDVDVNNYALNVGGNWANTGAFTERFGTVTFNGASAQTIAAAGGETFNNLNMTGAGSKSLSDQITINFDFALSSTLNANSKNISIRGNFDNSGTYNGGSNDVTFTNNSSVIGSSTTTFNNVIINATLTGHATNMNVTGNWTNNGTFVSNNGKVTFSGASQSIGGSSSNTFNHLELSGSSTKTLAAAITTNGNLTINSTFDVSASNYGVNVKGNWVNNGTFTGRNGTVTLNGTSAQSLGGTATTDFYNLTQSNSAGVSLAHAQNLINTLTISTGTFTSTGYNFTLKSTASNTARIATIPAGCDFAGNIIMERYAGSGPTDWRFLSSAVSGATLADWADDFPTSGFTGSTDPGNAFVSIYSYSESATGVKENGYVPATNVTNSIVNGRGYWVYLGPSPITYEVTGPPNKFVQSPSISYTSSGGIGEDGWNLIANPYPCEIDWDNANWTKTNVDNAVYIYNSDPAIMGFATYVGGIGVNGGSRYIASQQAFWIKANAASPGIALREQVKAGTNPSYLKTSVVNANGPIPNSIRLKVAGNGSEDETIIRFIQGASEDFDPEFDARKMVSVLNISSVISGDEDLSISQVPALSAAVSIPIRVTVSASGTYTIRRDSIVMMPSNACIMLEDKATGTMTDLQSNISYSFTIADTTSAPRFVIHFYPSVTKEITNITCAGMNNGKAVAAGAGAGPWTYVWKNADGSVLKTTNNSFSTDTLSGLSEGIYTLEVSGSPCGAEIDTFIIANPAPLELIAGFSDVSCNGQNDGSALAYASGGVAPYDYLWSNGATTASLGLVPAGEYTVSIKDANGCSSWFSASISAPVVADFGSSVDTVSIASNDSVVFNNASSGARYYEWNFGDKSPVNTTLNPKHMYDQPGTYTVVLVAHDSICFDTATKIVVVKGTLPTSIVTPSLYDELIDVYYDNGEVFLAFDLPRNENVTIQVTNMLGENVLGQNETNIRKNTVKLHVSDLSAGVYIASAEIGNAIVFKKFLIR